MRGNGMLVFLLLVIAAVVALLAMNDDGRIGSMSEGQFAETAYMGVWGLVLASGLVFVFRTNLTGALKSAAVYALGFVLLIGLYGYRAEFREVGDRFLATLVPGHAIKLAGTEASQYMVTRANDDHFRVEAEVNGKPVEFLVDTGASVVALDRDAAEAIGIDLSQLSFTAKVMTANGLADSAPVTLNSVRIGDIERKDVEAAVLDREGDGLSLLGMSFLNTLSSFDFRGERLVLTD